MAKLTTTSYAILGLLARQPWSAYELTKYMQHSGIRAVWPRTESRIYLEFKNLVEHKLASAKEATRQGRTRSVYSINAKGRKALSDWLETQEGSLRLESEPLLKLLFADLGEGSLDLQLDHMLEQVREEIQIMQAALQKPLEHGFSFADNAIHNAELVSLLTEMLSARVNWLTDMKTRNNKSSATNEEAAKAIYKAQAKKLDALARKLRD